MNTYIGIDPGTCKAGWALVSEDGGLMLSGIVSRSAFEGMARAIFEGDLVRLDRYVIEREIADLPISPVYTVLVGGGTANSYYSGIVEKLGYPPYIVPEYGSTLAARSLYWQLHPPAWIRRLFPLSMQVPPRDLDDLAAWRIVLNYLGKNS